MEKNSNLKSLFEVCKTQLDPFLDPEGQPDPFEPKNWAQNRVEPQKSGRVWPHYSQVSKKLPCLILDTYLRLSNDHE